MLNRKQRVKINDAYSSWKGIFCGISQGFILGLLLFNIHLCDLFYFLENLNIASYADDTTIYMVNEKNKTKNKTKQNKKTKTKTKTKKKVESVISTLEPSSSLLSALWMV